MFKNPFRYILQKLLGLDNYLFIFSVFTINRLRYNLYEKGFRYFLTLIPEDGNVLDIGSNIGIMSVPLARRVSKGKVFSFEPVPQNIKTQKRITAYYKLTNILIFETALGEKSGKINMVVPVLNNVKMYGLSHVVTDNMENSGEENFPVSINRLDEISEIRQLSTIHAIKIDVENFELEVLKGAEQLLKKHKPVIYCEIWDDEKRAQTFRYLKDNFNYEIKVFEKERLTDYLNQEATNFFFILADQNASPKST